MNPFRYNITLCFRHPNMDPKLISSALEMQPSRMWKAGDQRMNPRGLLLGGMNELTYWCSETIRGEGFDLAVTLETEVDKLEKRVSFLSEFCSTGGSIDFYIAWFTEEKNTGEVFNSQLLKRLAALQISLDFDVYGGRDPGQRAPDTVDDAKSRVV